MAAHMNSEELQHSSANPRALATQPFEILQAAADLLVTSETGNDALIARQVIIQCREHREALPEPLREVVDALIRELGLFPYLVGADLDDQALLSRETLRSADSRTGRSCCTPRRPASTPACWRATT